MNCNPRSTAKFVWLDVYCQFSKFVTLSDNNVDIDQFNSYSGYFNALIIYRTLFPINMEMFKYFNSNYLNTSIKEC